MDIHFDSLLGISRCIRARETSSEEVTSTLLERNGRYDGRLHSTLLVMADAAMAHRNAEIASGQ